MLQREYLHEQLKSGQIFSSKLGLDDYFLEVFENKGLITKSIHTGILSTEELRNLKPRELASPEYSTELFEGPLDFYFQGENCYYTWAEFNGIYTTKTIRHAKNSRISSNILSSSNALDILRLTLAEIVELRGIDEEYLLFDDQRYRTIPM